MCHEYKITSPCLFDTICHNFYLRSFQGKVFAKNGLVRNLYVFPALDDLPYCFGTRQTLTKM